MTGKREQQDGVIGEMLRDSGLEGSTELRDSLARLRALVPEQAPAPRADLAALLLAGARPSSTAGSSTAVTTAMSAVASPAAAADGTSPADGTGVTDLAGRRRKRRLAIVGGAVVGAMSLGAGAVAASGEDFRLAIGHTIGVLFQPAGHAPAPDPAQPSPAGIPAVPAEPTPAAPGPAPAPAATTPVAPEKAGPEKAAPAAPNPAAPRDAVPPAVGRTKELPALGGPPVPPNLPVLPRMPGPGGADDGALRPGVSPAPVVPALPGGRPAPSLNRP